MRFDKAAFKAKALMAKENFPRPKFKIKKKKVVSLIPNIATILGLSVGVSSIRFAMDQQYDFAVMSILIAAILDMMDGRLARMLNSESAIGAELDSLSDLVCFGVAPSLVLYIKFLSTLGSIGWVVVLMYISCMALRLARFNVLSQDPNQPEWACKFFLGVPAPMGAYLILSPLMFGFYLPTLSVLPIIYAFIVAFVSLLLVSRIPTFAIKRVSVSQRQAVPVMVTIILLIGFFLSEPWLMLGLVAPVYLLLIPFSMKQHKKLRKSEI